ncbi:hypothetical protein MKW98_003094 [Papaver atlanticum]|uniref:Beta'-coat protein n=1 Tax=Papaver atlanticum TaxID=357466 RepID=A0AAD4TEZ1_9MAGN|nr:hypothetical protein MKW98_003094 [Papaver atlanticum]
MKPLRLDIKKKLAQRSERVKSVDLHPSEPWILASLYSGSVCIWNYQSQTMVKSFEVTELPVRSSKFIARKQWVVAGADDMYIGVYNYNTMDKVNMFEAHTDYIRCVAVHPTLPYLWDWEKGWMCTQIFEGHSYYVMQVTFDPKDTNTSASASLDRRIKIWNLGSPDPNFTLDAHLKGVNCVEYFTGGDKPYLITGSDDQTAKVWDYQTKSCVQTLEGHTHNVSAVSFHPELPIIITGSEDGTVRIGKDVPVASMDSSGKITWAKHNEIQTVNIKSVGADVEVTDGERLPLAVHVIFTPQMGSIVSEKVHPRIKIFSKTFQEKKSIRPTFSAERIFGGTLLAMCSNDFICFYDWAECRLIRRIDVNVKNVYWADSGDLVAIASDTSFYILKYNRDIVNSTWRLHYCVGGEVTTMFHLDRPMYLLGYLASHSRVYLIDKQFNVIGYTLLLSLIECKTLVMRGDLERASQILPSIPKEHHNSVAHFLESRGMLEDALEVATDPNYRFDLAIQLGRLYVAKAIAVEVKSESKWKQLGELAMSSGKLEMAEECLQYAMDLSGLLLLYSSLGNSKGITELASLAKEQGKNNVAFLCLYL